MIKIFLKLWFLWVLLPVLGTAQNLILEGQIVNSKTGEPAPFTNIHLGKTGIGTSSNLTGQFTLKFPPQMVQDGFNLIISCIGYESFRIPLSNLDLSEDQVFKINPATTTLDGIVIGSRRDRSNVKAALRIVSRAFQRIPRNYSNGNYKLETFYRHYCKEDEEYGRLIEGAVNIYDNKGYNKFFDLPPDKMELKVEQLRRSFDFTDEARNYHTPIALNFILSQEVTSYLYKNRLKENLGNFEFEIVDTTAFDNKPVFVISFDQMSGFQNNESGFNGRLYIDATDFAFVRVQSEIETTKESDYDSSYLVLNRLQNYRKHEGVYYASHLVSDGYGDYSKYDTLGKLTSNWNHSAHVEIIATNILPGKEFKFQGEEPTKADLLQIQYDSIFWDNYNILKATPLEEEIERDLARRAPLDQQFKTYNLVHGGGKSILENEQLRQLLDKYRGQVIYAVIWSSASYPNFYELNPIPFFNSKINRDKVIYLFVSIDEDEEEWNQTRRYQQLNVAGARHHRIPLNLNSYISEQYYSNSFPMFLLLDRMGELVSEGGRRPNDILLKEEIKPLLRKSYYQDKANEDDLISKN